MKKISLFILALSLVAGVAFAQGGKPVTTTGSDTSASAIQLSGEIDWAWVFSGRSLQESRWWGTFATGPLKTANYHHLYGMVRMDVAVTDGIDAVMTIENNPYENATGPTNSQTNSYNHFMGLEIGLMNFKIKELFVQGLSLQLGVQDFKLDSRGRGQSFFLDVRNSYSPWPQVNSPSSRAVAAPSTVGANFAGGFVLRHPVGLTLDYNMSPVEFKLMAADVNTNLFNSGALGAAGNFVNGGQEDILVTNFSYDLGKDKIFNLGKGSNVNFTFAWFRGGLNMDQSGIVIGGSDPTTASNQNVITGGIGWDMRDFLTPGLEFYAEGYIQGGNAGNNIVNNKISQNSGAVYGGLRYDFQNIQYKPWIDASFWWKGGDKNMGSIVDNKYQGFMGYSSVNDFALVEGILYGLGVQTGYYAPKVEAGFTVDVGNSRTIDFTAKWAYFNWTHAMPLNAAPFNSKKLGNEVDLMATLNYSKNVSFYTEWAGLFGSNSLQFYNSTGSKRANLVLLGSTLMF